MRPPALAVDLPPGRILRVEAVHDQVGILAIGRELTGQRRQAESVIATR